MNVIFIDDNEDFIFFIKRAMDKLSLPVKHDIIPEGRAALEILQNKSLAQNIQLIILDVNMPIIDGFDILRKIKSSETLRRIPVIMLSTSENPLDVNQAVDLGANSYVVKPRSFSRLKTFLSDTFDFWLNHNYTSRLISQ